MAAGSNLSDAARTMSTLTGVEAMAEPGNGDDPATNGAGSPRHWTPFSITTAVAIPLLAIAVSIVAVIVTGSGGSKSGATTGPTTTRSASSTELLDPCLVGTWLQQDRLPDKINMPDKSVVKSVTRNGTVSLHFGSDLRGEAVADLQLVGTQDGKHIEVDVTGTDAFTYTVRDSYMHIVRASKASNWRQALYVDDQKVGTFPGDTVFDPAQVACTQAHLTVTAADGSTTHYDRA
ncbi:hypothetical protein ACH40F_13510 [Streptomyces sp. NPDC020794]|uniref:hypothetical protein n=1 Tax=unclassified Streptomyces TaxID=2593676 RepID=UPI0036E6C915